MVQFGAERFRNGFPGKTSVLSNKQKSAGTVTPAGRWATASETRRAAKSSSTNKNRKGLKPPCPAPKRGRKRWAWSNSHRLGRQCVCMECKSVRQRTHLEKATKHVAKGFFAHAKSRHVKKTIPLMGAFVLLLLVINSQEKVLTKR